MIAQQKHKIIFRGKQAEVVFEDHGYEVSCNVHVIDWWFSNEAMNEAILVTDDEEQTVLEELRSISQALVA